MNRDKRLAKRKEWRIKKYSKTPQDQLSCTTISLFKEWHVPLVGPKKVKGKKVVNKYKTQSWR